jgi:NTE family protein
VAPPSRLADPRDRRWTAACLSHGDHVVALVEKSGTIPNRHPVWPADAPTLQPTTLVILHPVSTRLPSGTAGVLRQLPANAHLHVRIDRDDDVGRVARMLAGVPYCLVLSGGGALGFAHLGAVQAMRELGIPCDVVGGTSIGAVMAAYQGMDLGIEEQISQTEADFKGLMDYTLPVVSLLKGRRTSERIQRHAGDHTIEDLWIPYFCISTNLSTNNMKIHDRGSIATAVRASLALPGVFPPVHDGEHFLIDGGVLNNFPLDVMHARNPFGKVIAVDVAANVLLEAVGNFGLQLSGWRAAVSMLRRKPLAPSIAITLVRTSMIGSARDHDRYLQLRFADVHIELVLKETGLLDFGGVRPIAEYGYRGSLPQLASWWAQVDAQVRDPVDDAAMGPGGPINIPVCQHDGAVAYGTSRR